MTVKVQLPDFDRALWHLIMEHSHAEGRTPTEVVMAWMRRAVRQASDKGYVMPAAPVEDRKVLPIRSVT